MSTAPPGRVPIEPVIVWWRMIAAVVLVVAMGACVQRLFATGFSFAWGGAAVLLLVVAGKLFVGARAEACGACGALVSIAIVRLPVEIADDLARAVQEHGSLEPARPNHVPRPGADAYCALLGVYCAACRKAARVHVSRYGKLSAPHVAATVENERAVSWQPLSTEQLLDQSSAEFLSVLARGPVR